MAKLYKSHTGIVGLPRTDYINAAVAIECGGIIIAVGTTDADCWRFKNGAWTEVNSDITGAGGTPGGIYADSRGYFYTSFNNGQLYRSIDEGVSWVSVNSATLTTGYQTPMAENEDGDLVYGNYSNDAGPTTAELFRSTDGGANWTDITANLAGAYQRHIHNCYYDHYRGALLVGGGDAGATDKIEISFDFGTTFAQLTGTTQSTAMCSDASNFYYVADTGTDRDIYKMAIGAGATTAAAWNAVTPTSVFDPTSDADISTLDVFTWQMVDFGGVLVTTYGKGSGAAIMVASEDEGVTWTTLDKITGSSQRIAFEGNVPSYYADWGGMLYSVNSSNHYLYQWRAYRDAGYISINNVGAASDARHPLKTLRDDTLGTGARLKLTSDYDQAVEIQAVDRTIKVGAKNMGLTLNGGTYTIDEDFEGTSSLGTGGISAGVVIDQADTAKFFGGTRSASIDTTGGSTGTPTGQLQDLGFGAVAGDEVWVSGRFFIDSGVWGANTALRTIFMEDNAFVPLAAIAISTTREWYLQYNAFGTSRGANQRIATPIKAGLQQWQKLKLGVYLHATDGWIKAYVDGLLISEVSGIQTVFDTGVNQVKWGIQSANKYKYHYDNCKAAIGFDDDRIASRIEGGGGGGSGSGGAVGSANIIG